MTHLMMLKNMSALYRELSAEKKIALIEANTHQLYWQLTMQAELVEEARRIRHDMWHHNMQIAEYVQNDSKDELLKYLGEYEKEAKTNVNVCICENIVANNIISAYQKKANQHGIKVQIDVTLEKNIAISHVDLVAMLANLMDNAINGCIHSGKSKPWIDLYIGRKASKLVIYIKNTAGEVVKFEKGIPKSKSSDGIGVSSILYRANRYGGKYDFQLVDGLFSCQLLLKVPVL